MRNRHKIGLGRPGTKHKLGLEKALEAVGSVAASDRDPLTGNERILRDFFWLRPAVQTSAPVRLPARRSSASAAESGAAPRIAKKTD